MRKRATGLTPSGKLFVLRRASRHGLSRTLLNDISLFSLLWRLVFYCWFWNLALVNDTLGSLQAVLFVLNRLLFKRSRARRHDSRFLEYAVKHKLKVVKKKKNRRYVELKKIDSLFFCLKTEKLCWRIFCCSENIFEYLKIKKKPDELIAFLVQ